jgi:hypothetical protein
MGAPPAPTPATTPVSADLRATQAASSDSHAAKFVGDTASDTERRAAAEASGLQHLHHAARKLRSVAVVESMLESVRKHARILGDDHNYSNEQRHASFDTLLGLRPPRCPDPSGSGVHRGLRCRNCDRAACYGD